MAKSEARRQKQLAKKKAKRVEKRTELSRLTSDDPFVRLATADAWPIIETLVPVSLWEHGIGSVILTRRAPGGQFAFARFLVDVWCLGVKDADWRIMNGSAYNKVLKDMNRVGELREVVPEYFAKLVFSSVEYAQSLGLAPHPDYGAARLLLQGIDPSLCTDTFEFGKNGKPYYFRGPRDSFAKAQSIADRVHAAGGHFVLGLQPGASEIDLLDHAEKQGLLQDDEDLE